MVWTYKKYCKMCYNF